MTTLDDAVRNELRTKMEQEVEHWTRMPLRVAIMLHGESETQFGGAISRALSWWNDALDFTAFVECDVINEEWDVDVMFMPGSDNHMAVCWLEKIAPDRIQAHIEIRGPQDELTIQELVQHELGHALGLPHCEGTIMSATMTPILMGEWFDDHGRIIGPRTLSVLQKKWLRRRYHDKPAALGELAEKLNLTDDPSTVVTVEKLK